MDVHPAHPWLLPSGTVVVLVMLGNLAPRQISPDGRPSADPSRRSMGACVCVCGALELRRYFDRGVQVLPCQRKRVRRTRRVPQITSDIRSTRGVIHLYGKQYTHRAGDHATG